MSTSFQQSPDIFLNAVRTNNLFHYFSFSVNNHCIWNAVYLIFISKNRLRIRITDICPWHVIKSIDGRFFVYGLSGYGRFGNHVIFASLAVSLYFHFVY